jgi:DNA repair protein RadC
MDSVAFVRETRALDSGESPANRLKTRGASALSTSELLSVVMYGGNGKSWAEDLGSAGLLLGKMGCLRQLAVKVYSEVAAEVAPSAALRVLAALELARRTTEEEVRLAETLSGAEEAYRFLKPRLRDLPHEVFAVIFLNQKHGVLAYREMFQGSIHASSVHPREVVKAVLRENAAAVILSHNHPSGHVSPSPDDLRLTEDLKGILAHLDVRVVDHLIVGGNGYFSFAREGLLNR